MYQGREEPEPLTESQVPTVVAGHRFPTRKWGKEMAKGIEVYFRKMEGGQGPYFFPPVHPILCVTGMLYSLLIPSTCLGSALELGKIKIYLYGV